MKNYFTIAILGLFFCNSALALSFGAPPVIPIDEKQVQEAQEAQEEAQEAVTNHIKAKQKYYEEKHYCLSFNFVRKQGVAFETLIYECAECGRQVQILPPDTIENKIADNKRIMELEKAAMNALTLKNQSVSNQQKPTTTSKPQKKSTSTPSTTKKQQSSTKKSTSTPSTTKKQQSSTKKTNVSPTKNTTPNATSKPPEPTTEENLCKVSDGLDAFIDMVKKFSNSGDNSCPLYNNPRSPNYDPNKELSVSEADLQKLASIMKEKFSDEAESHFGRNVASLIPYSLDEVIYELRNGNPNNIYIELGDRYHQDDERSTFTKDGEAIVNIIEGVFVGAKYVANKTAEHNDTLLKKITGAVFGAAYGAVSGGVFAADTNTKIEGSEKVLEYLEWMRTEGSISNVKIGLSGGREAVYSLDDGRIVKDEKLGTQNFGERGVVSSFFGNHEEKDIDPNDTKAIPGNSFTRDGDQYKYVGILYERDENYPNKFYIIDGQTGKRMTAKQAYEFAASISDMWVEENHQQSVIDPIRNRNMGLWD